MLRMYIFTCFLQYWDGSSFSKTTLKDIGLTIQLNHASFKC